MPRTTLLLLLGVVTFGWHQTASNQSVGAGKGINIDWRSGSVSIEPGKGADAIALGVRIDDENGKGVDVSAPGVKVGVE